MRGGRPPAQPSCSPSYSSSFCSTPPAFSSSSSAPLWSSSKSVGFDNQTADSDPEFDFRIRRPDRQQWWITSHKKWKYLWHGTWKYQFCERIFIQTGIYFEIRIHLKNVIITNVVLLLEKYANHTVLSNKMMLVIQNNIEENVYFPVFPDTKLGIKCLWRQWTLYWGYLFDKLS